MEGVSMRKRVILFLVLLPLLFVPTVYASGETQESSFSVNPLPFFETENNYGTSVNYANQKVNFDYSQDTATHEDSVEYFNETTIDDTSYSPDPIKHSTHYGLHNSSDTIISDSGKHSL